MVDVAVAKLDLIQGKDVESKCMRGTRGKESNKRKRQRDQ